jgi:ATP-dependent helicase HrpB
MVRLPLHPRLAHMVVKGKSPLAADLAALLSERDGLPRDVGVDITARLAQLRGGARDRIRQTAKQIRQIAGIKERGAAASPGVLVAWAFPDRIAQRRGGDRRYRLSGGGGAILPEHDALVTQDFLAVATTDGASGDQKIYLAASLSLKPKSRSTFGEQIEARRTASSGTAARKR